MHLIHRAGAGRLGVFTGALSVLILTSGCFYYSSNNASFVTGDLRSTASRVRSEPILAGINRIEVANRFGEVRVVADAPGSLGWSWRLKAWAKSDALATNAAAAANLMVETNGQTLRLAFDVPNANVDRRYGSELEIHAPKACAIEVENQFGSILIRGVDGPVSAHSQSGLVDVRGIQGKVRAQTSFAALKAGDCGPATLINQSGEIQAAHIHGALEAGTSFARLIAKDVEGPLTARNQSGSIEAVRVKGKVDARTSFAQLVVDSIDGDAHLANQSGGVNARKVNGSINASTSFADMEIEGSGRVFVCHNQSGAIRLRAQSNEFTRIEARTSFNSIDLRLPAGSKAAIRAHTSFGDIQSDFPVMTKARGADPFAGVEAGTPLVTLEDQSGSIRIRADK